METKDLPHGIVGFKFAQALYEGDYHRAHVFLSPELKLQYSVEGLQNEFEDMMSIADPAFSGVVVMDNCRHPEMDTQGWAYVAISTEAVVVTVKLLENQYLITDLEWGRP